MHVTRNLWILVKLLLQHIRYKESCFHVKLLRQQRHYHYKGLRSTETIDVYPQVIIDVPNVSLNSNKWDYLSRTGPNYIRLDQSYLYFSERQQKQMQREHENIMNTITTNLVHTYHMPNIPNIINQFSQQLTTCLQEQYTVPISYLDIKRTRKEWKLMKSIQFRLKKEKYILRVIDKSSIFHLGHTTDYERKAQERTLLRSITSSINSPIIGISKFLDQLIRPLFDKHVRSTAIIDGVDLIHRFETYNENGYLKPTTQLYTLDILEYNYHKVKGIPLDAIRKLARLVVTENVFIYEKKFYRQVMGDAMGSTFTLTLANIFIWKWEKVLIHRQLAANEIYGR